MTATRYAYCGHDHPTGYGVAATRAASAMRTAGATVQWVPITRSTIDGQSEWTVNESELLALGGRIDDVEVLIAHLPPDHARWIRRTIPHRRFIVHTVWETDTLPREWDGYLHADAFIVPTEWNAELLRSAGVHNVHVVPHVIPPNVSADATASLPVAIDPDCFVFYVINTWHERKGMEETVEAYLRAFDADDRVILVVKTEPVGDGRDQHGPLPTWILLSNIVKGFRRPAKILLVGSKWSDAEIAALHRRGDCYLSLTHSEGWGLGIFDAVLHENPVITTNWGGPAEYLRGYPGLIDSDLAPARMYHLPYGQWAQPRSDHAVELLRSVYADRGASLTAASAAHAGQLRTRCAPERVGRLLLAACTSQH